MRRVLGGSAGAIGEKSFEILVTFRIFSGLGGRLRIRFRIREMGAWCGHTTCPPLDPLLVSSRDAGAPLKLTGAPPKFWRPRHVPSPPNGKSTTAYILSIEYICNVKHLGWRLLLH